MRDHLEVAIVVGHPVRVQAAAQPLEAGAAVGVRPADRLAALIAGGAGEGVEIGGASRGVVEQPPIEQDLDPDVGHAAGRTAAGPGLAQRRLGVAAQRVERGQAMEGGVGRVMQRYAARDRGVADGGQPRSAHPGEVGEHGAQGHRGALGAGAVPGRDRGVAEEVHATL